MIRVARSDTDPDWYTLYSVPDSEPDERSGQRIYSVSVKMPRLVSALLVFSVIRDFTL